jgi:hypothetical protein
MKKYIIYRSTDGLIIGHGTSSDCDDLTVYNDSSQSVLVVDDSTVFNDSSTIHDLGMLLGCSVIDGEIFNPDPSTAPSAEEIEQAWNQLRVKRFGLLSVSDWTQLPDVPLETKNAWSNYRQELRNITNQPGAPFEVTWPTKPL